jgi:hypothetical protein
VRRRWQSLMASPAPMSSTGRPSGARAQTEPFQHLKQSAALMLAQGLRRSIHRRYRLTGRIPSSGHGTCWTEVPFR